MGCVATKLDINDVHPNMFAVNNVDDVSTNSTWFVWSFTFKLRLTYDTEEATHQTKVFSIS